MGSLVFILIFWHQPVFYTIWKPFTWLVGYLDPRKPQATDALYGKPRGYGTGRAGSRRDMALHGLESGPFRSDPTGRPQVPCDDGWRVIGRAA